MGRYPGPRDLWYLPPSGIGDGRNDFRGDAKTSEVVVSGDVVRDEPEVRRKCDWHAESPGAGQLSHGMDLASQTAPRDGPTRSRQALRGGGS